MIRYSLICAEGHAFDSWFASASAFDDLAARGLLSCATCGSSRVEKALMAPAVTSASPDEPPPLSAPRDLREALLAEIRRQIEEKSDYVGLSFAAEARAIHEGRAPERSIWGEARPEEARSLIEDGIPVAPLPFMPRRQTN
ncbi:Uncharacterized protein putative in bacteria [Rubellimicrobium thermophilum DSM 16684]|uniref:Uncharacterized protein putative in bacteria n=1 Tax=Rubellimicrobium thermophilum DSM 16684 TaxID=1123069 RepID=S9RWI5_9RHOB|nr:DUF1178 family protein [Rubellimicrobium thermophilum]EPX82395.1 Uncharacterized protein putative in bacteria [Rubellimicrobium thermophilum DSM 16684]